jgi:hypothetical protein
MAVKQPVERRDRQRRCNDRRSGPFDSRSVSARDIFRRAESPRIRSASGGTIAISRSIGSGSQSSAASVAISGPIESIPHFSLSGSTLDRTPDWRIHNSARPGSAALSSVLSSFQTRSDDSVSSFSRARAQAFNAAASGRPAP